MALPAHTSRFSLVFALAAAGVTVANAQFVNQLNPIERLSGVVQFGVPRDTKFVFCDGEDCPERSIKHLHIPPQPLPLPQPQSARVLTELSRAKVDPVKLEPAKRKPKHRRSTVKYECKPAPTK
ncbi:MULTISPECIES: hypothetical protein [Burkholderiaceae]|uniref:hypothetical protein n=1 Tax=Burkholderiaceae TaxID=119060 RepID=UPI0009698B67|nr:MULTISPECIES: hypothetical protein [Burkholderiaceae]MCG1040518.1 hypothetical protein [Mycetohabitans sp. B7]SIT64934.1 hypothetical protein SAMN04487769_0158 [Burkholderia sp. b14]